MFGDFGKWILPPILYAASVPLLLIISLILMFGIYGAFGYVWPWITGVLLMLGSGVVFVLFSLGLARFERPRSSNISMHLRHCAMFYAGMVPLGVFLIPELVGPWCRTLQWSFGAILFLATAYAVGLNALTIYALRRHANLRHRPQS